MRAVLISATQKHVTYQLTLHAHVKCAPRLAAVLLSSVCTALVMSLMHDKVIRSENSGRQYHIVKVLGSGAFGEVLLAEDPFTQQQYAVKQLYLRGQQEGLPLAIAREMAALQQLQHPNVVSLIDVATQGPCFYLIQELCMTDLAALLNGTNHRLPCSIVRSIMQQLLHAVAEVHARGLMHRDVKPSNVLISPGGVIKLADFGLARCCCNNLISAAGSGSQHKQQQLCIHQQQMQELQHCSNQAICKQSMQVQLQPYIQQRSSDHPMQPPHQQHTGQQQQQHPSSHGKHHEQLPLHMQPLQQLGEEYQQQIQCCAHLPQQHSRYQAALEQQLPAGHLTAAQGTRWYRAPELLYGSRQYSPAADIWAVGMVFAEILGLSPFIPGQSDIDQLALMQQTLGSISVQDWPEAEHLPDWHKICFAPNTRQPLAELLPDAPEDALDLLQQMIPYNPNQRLSAAAALQHEFFTCAVVASPLEVAVMVENLLAVEQPTSKQLSNSVNVLID